MRRTFVVGLALVLGLYAAAEEKKAEALDPAKIEGAWEFKSGEKNGQKASDDSLKAKVKITKDKITMGEGEMLFEFKYTLDVKASPAAIDMEITKGPIGVGSKSKGIIAVDGEELKLAYAPDPEGARPTKFDGAKAHYFVLKKGK